MVTVDTYTEPNETLVCRTRGSFCETIKSFQLIAKQEKTYALNVNNIHIIYN
jgi:hypothetical protein